MKVKLFWASLVLLLAALAIFAARGQVDDAVTAHDNYRLEYQACWFDVPWPREIRCAELHTPAAQGEFVLPVVIIHDQSVNHQPDPVMYLAGGPGASVNLSQEGIAQWLNWLDYADLGRDLILMDPRGVGRAKPEVTCAAFNRFNVQLFKLSLPLAEELEQSYLIEKHCFEQLAESEFSLTANRFGSALSAADIRGLLALLNYSEWNILGVSYGTRLALEVARQEVQLPQRVTLKSMVLDSVYPAGFGGVQTWPQVLQSAFMPFFDSCAQTEDCPSDLATAGVANLAELFKATLVELRERPIELTIPRWDGEAPITLMVNDHRFLSASFAAIYNPENWLKIRAAMLDVKAHRSEKLKDLFAPYINNSLATGFNSLAFMLVDCADNPIGSSEQFDAQVEQFPYWADYTRDQWRFQICHALYADAPAAGLVLAEPRVPSLMLSGQLDPITPPEWAQALVQQWPQMQWRKVPTGGHNLLGEDMCLLAHLRQFFDQPTHQFTGCENAN